MRKKILYLLLSLCLIVSCAVIFTACGDEADATLYHLTFSSNITLTNEQKSEIKALYGYGEQRESCPESSTERPNDEIEALKSAGATQEDIDKAGVRQADGSYYFFDQDPIYLTAPLIDGYKFLGFYNKADNNDFCRAKVSYDSRSAKKYYPRWEMDNKDVELEARYEEIEYNVVYTYCVDSGNNITLENPPQNPTHYNAVKDGIYTIIKPDEASNPSLAKYDFVKMYYTNIVGLENPVSEIVTCTTLPRKESEIPEGASEICIFVEYTIKKYDVNVYFTLDGVDYDMEEDASNVQLAVYDIDDRSAPFIISDRIKHGDKIGFYLDCGNMNQDFEVEGVFVGDNKINVSTVVSNYEITSDTSIEIRIKSISNPT